MHKFDRSTSPPTVNRLRIFRYFFHFGLRVRLSSLSSVLGIVGCCGLGDSLFASWCVFSCLPLPEGVAAGYYTATCKKPMSRTMEYQKLLRVLTHEYDDGRSSCEHHTGDSWIIFALTCSACSACGDRGSDRAWYCGCDIVGTCSLIIFTLTCSACGESGSNRAWYCAGDIVGT